MNMFLSSLLLCVCESSTLFANMTHSNADIGHLGGGGAAKVCTNIFVSYFCVRKSILFAHIFA